MTRDPMAGGARPAEGWYFARDGVGPLLLMFPGELEEREWEDPETHAKRTSEAVLTRVIEVVNPTLYVDRGEQPIFWQEVKKELLRQSTDDYPWVVGKIQKASRAYFLRPPTPEEAQQGAAALDRWQKATKEGITEEPF